MRDRNGLPKEVYADLKAAFGHRCLSWIGVDRGGANLATTSDGTDYQGRLSRYRRWQARNAANRRRRLVPPGGGFPAANRHRPVVGDSRERDKVGTTLSRTSSAVHG
ncbi:hypothetical protein [Streptomyces sp. NPDC097610]|uniref:hypothetical protein n=1 Tax=Streptomyces sp. NPDC097610 TaxID=3157227 RepID=UPI00332A9DB9